MHRVRIRGTFALIAVAATALALACVRERAVKNQPASSSAQEAVAQTGVSAPNAKCDQSFGVDHWCCDTCAKNGNVPGTDDGMEIHLYIPPEFMPARNDFYNDLLPLVAAGKALALHQEHWACSRPYGLLAADGRLNPLTSGPPPPLPLTGTRGFGGGPYSHYCRDPNDVRDRCPLEPGTGSDALSEMGGILFAKSTGGNYDYIFIPCSLKQGITTYDAAAAYRRSHTLQTLNCTGTHTTSDGGDNMYGETTFKCH